MITIRAEALATMIAHARTSGPVECAGLLQGIGRTVVCARPLRLEHAGKHRYRADPLDLVRGEDDGDRRGRVLIGYYHSHGDQPPDPSRTDMGETPWPGRHPDMRILISVSRSEPPGIRAFRVGPREWLAVPLHTLPWASPEAGQAHAAEIGPHAGPSIAMTHPNQ